MLVVDLDGTTLTADRTLAPADVAAAERLRSAGIPVTIATGRLFTGTQWVAQALGVSGAVAVMNGSELVDATSGVTLHGRYVAPSARAILRDTVAALPIAPFLFESRSIHFAARHARHSRYLAVWTEWLTEHADVFDAPAWGTSEQVVAVGLSGPHDAIEDARARLTDALGLGVPGAELEAIVFPTFEGDAFLKLRHAAEDKGTALARLAEERGLPIEATVAVGDWFNDIPMLRVAGRSFAMAHARDSVRDEADEVLDASRDGGAIAEVARRVWGL